MNRPFCVVDTCALRYWKGIELGRRPLYEWLSEEFSVCISDAVANEIRKQLRFWEDEAPKIRKFVEDTEHPLSNTEVFEKVLLSPFVNNSSLNTEEGAGERRNFCITVNVVRYDECRHVLFLTDDLKAIRKFLEKAFNTFRVGCIWNSYDFILYLFIRHRSFIPLLDAQNALKDLTGNMTKEVMGRRLKERLIDYSEKLKTIAEVTERLP